MCFQRLPSSQHRTKPFLQTNSHSHQDTWSWWREKILTAGGKANYRCDPPVSHVQFRHLGCCVVCLVDQHFVPSSNRPPQQGSWAVHDFEGCGFFPLRDFSVDCYAFPALVLSERKLKRWPNGLASQFKFAKTELAYGLAKGGQTDSQVDSQVHASRKKL